MEEKNKEQRLGNTDAQVERHSVDVVDLEEYAKAGQKPPYARNYRIRVDKQVLTIDASSLTGQDILSRAGKQPPERYLLYRIYSGGREKKIGLDEVVDFTEPGVEKFTTLLISLNDGAV